MTYPNFERLVKVIAKLRDPNKGCPWDIKQTHKSLLEFLLEESYEFMHAVELNDIHNMEEELGDVLLQVILHCQIAKESKSFDIDSVSKKIADKMERRHPHVFRDNNNKVEEDEVKIKWQEIKTQEKLLKNKSSKTYHIDESYLQLPSLMTANKIGKKTKFLNFDWENSEEVALKVEEEWVEFKEELIHGADKNKERIEEEYGDLLFSIAQLGRHLKINPEFALRDANKKFIRRFNYMEDLINEDELQFESMPQKEKDLYWNKVKQIEKSKIKLN